MNLEKYWYTAKEACEIKGVSYHTLRKREADGRTRRYLLPNYGRGTQVLSFGKYREMYSREQVSEWLPKTQEQIERELCEQQLSRSTHSNRQSVAAN